MRMRSKWARATAAAGAACLLVLPLSGGAGAATGSDINVYESAGTGRGIGLRFAVTPSIFDPLLDVALLHGTTSITSQGAGEAQAIASLLFPGMLGVGGAGCAGVPGGAWVQAFTPPPEGCANHQEATINPDQRSKFTPAFDAVANEVLDRVSLNQGKVRAHTEPPGDMDPSRPAASSVTYVQDLALSTMPNGPAIVHIDSLRIVTQGWHRGEVVSHDVTVTANGVSLLDGMIIIDSIRSRATTASTPLDRPEANGTLTVKDVMVQTADEAYHATIDHEGVRITDPALSREERIGLQEGVDEALLDAGILVTVAEPVEIVDGSRAEATVGGLVLSLTGRVPTVTVPDELAPALADVFEQVPTLCAYDFGADALPVCFGAGVLPGPGTQARASFSIASASAFTVGERLDLGFGGGGGGDPFPNDPSDPFCCSGPIDPIGPVDPGPTSIPPDTTSFPPATPKQPKGPLVGLVAKMPSGALLGGGLGLLVLALGLSLGPSLRHAGPR